MTTSFGLNAASGVLWTMLGLGATVNAVTAQIQGSATQFGSIDVSIAPVSADVATAVVPTGTVAASVTPPVAAVNTAQITPGSIAVTMAVASASAQAERYGKVAQIHAELALPAAQSAGLQAQRGVIVAAPTPAGALITGVMWPSGVIDAQIGAARALVTGGEDFVATVSATSLPAQASAEATQIYAGPVQATVTDPHVDAIGTQTQRGAITASVTPAGALTSGIVQPRGAIAASASAASASLAGFTQVTLPITLTSASYIAVALSPAGVGEEIFVANSGSIIVLSGGQSTTVSVTGLGGVGGLAVGPSRSLYVADYENNAVYKLSGGPTGPQSTLNFNSLDDPSGIAVDSDDNVYVSSTVASTGNGVIYQLTSSGTQNAFPPLSGDAGTILPPVGGIAVDSSENMYASQSSSIVKISASASGDDVSTLAFPASGSQYEGVAVDSAGNVYASDETANVVYKLTPSGVLTTMPFSGLNTPNAVAVDSNDNVYVLSSGNNTIYIIPA